MNAAYLGCVIDDTTFVAVGGKLHGMKALEIDLANEVTRLLVDHFERQDAGLFIK